MANKAGLVITGFAKAEQAIASRAIAGLVHAADCGADGMRKLGQCLRRRYGDDEARPRVNLFTSEPIGFGIGTDKCDTCGSDRRTGKRGVFGTLPEVGAIPVRNASGGKPGRAVRTGLNEIELNKN